METNITKSISDELKSSVPTLIKSTLEDLLPCMLAEKSLSKVLWSEMGTSVSEKVYSGMQDVRADLDSQIKHLGKYCSDVQGMQIQLSDIQSLLESAVIVNDTTEGEKTKQDTEAILDPTQGEKKKTKSLIPSEPTVASKEEQPSEPVVADKPDEDKQLTIHNSGEKKLNDIITVSGDSDDDDLDKQPLSKKFKIMPDLLTPTPLMTVVLEPIKQQTYQDFTNKLFDTTSSSFSPTPPREPTPHKDPSKGKRVANEEEQVNILILFQQEEGSNLELPKLKSFSTPELTLSPEEFKARLIEMQSEWLEIHYLASKISGQANNYNLQSRRGKFQWLVNESKKFGISPPPELASFGLTAEEKKRKRSQMLEQVFVTGNMVADGCQRNITPPAGVQGKNGKLDGKHQLTPQKYSSQRHCQGSRRLLEDLLVSWEGYQLICSWDTLRFKESHMWILDTSQLPTLRKKPRT
nr:hypothetical protein [Tanacetum cinerariifolium]